MKLREPTPVKNIRHEDDLEDEEKGIIALVSVNMKPIREELDARAVKKLDHSQADKRLGRRRKSMPTVGQSASRMAGFPPDMKHTSGKTP